MKHPVIAIGLDSAEPTLIEKWIAEGRLKNISRLWNEGAHARLENFKGYSAELPWTTFLTGCAPDKTGFWSPIEYHEDSYGVSHRGAYDFGEFKPFFALGERYRVIAFDVPQMRLCDDVNGLQALAWGAHSPQTESVSSPPSLLQDLISKHGEHPALHKDNAEVWQDGELDHVMESMLTGIERRATICTDLMRREPWDLFVTVFGEPHSVGHMHWHQSQPDHPLYELCKKDGEDPMIRIHEAVDEAIGRICEAAPEGTRVVVFSAHGMEANTMDVPSMFFLPELLYRYSFPGKAAIAKGSMDELTPVEDLFDGQRSWALEIWARKEDWNPLRRLARKYPGRARRLFPMEQLFGSGDGPAHPRNFSEETNFIPATWYSNMWPEMTAFALPGFADGCVRVNLRGREPQGIVDPSDYNKVLDEVSQHLRALINPRTGKKVVADLIRTRQSAEDRDPKLPDADLIVLWSHEPADVVDSPAFGRIGPVPFRRGGSHTREGFVAIGGPQIPHGELRLGHAVDLAPTILQLMGAPIANHFDGTSLFNRPGEMTLGQA